MLIKRTTRLSSNRRAVERATWDRFILNKMDLCQALNGPEFLLSSAVTALVELGHEAESN